MNGCERTVACRPAVRSFSAAAAIAPEKDVLTLLEAFSLLVREGRDVYLLNRSGGFREFLEQAGEGRGGRDG